MLNDRSHKNAFKNSSNNPLNEKKYIDTDFNNPDLSKRGSSLSLLNNQMTTK